MSFNTNDTVYLEALEGFCAGNRLRRMRVLDGSQGARVNLDGKEVLNFCSNDYLGLAADPRLQEAAEKAMKIYGFGAGASRLVCGNMTVHRQLEARLAEIKGTESCVLFSTGYMANVGILSALCTRGDQIFADRLNHASLVDGALLSRADLHRYTHTDMTALEDSLKKTSSESNRMIVTDSVFSMDGDVAPLDQIVALAQQYQASVMVDEAHAFGVLGKNGKGAVEHFDLKGRIPIQMGTLSKAVGAFGAYCCGSKALIDYLINSARSLIYTTGIPPSVAAAALAGADIILTEPERRERLWELTDFLHHELKQSGIDILNSATPIIPILIGDDDKVVRFSQLLLEKGIFIAAIRPPTVPKGKARLRLTVTAAHTNKDCEFLLDQLQKIGRELCLI